MMRLVKGICLTIALSGCADGLASTSANVDQEIDSPSSIRRTTYADGSGEPYPTSSTALASITYKKSDFLYPNCDLANNACTIQLKTQHKGIWNGTEQIVTTANDGANVPAITYSGGATCIEWENLPETKCVQKRVERTLNYSIPCGQQISGNVVHKAWWLGFWGGAAGGSGASLNIPGFRIGEVQDVSFPATFDSPNCPQQSSGGGGGGSGAGQCVQHYGIWYDPRTGVIVSIQYLLTTCGGYAQ